jgi:hypothetical protein
MWDLLKEVFVFLRSRKKLWLMPIIVMLVLLGAMLILSETSALTPFIYSIF